jgi:hypothetical protein
VATDFVLGFESGKWQQPPAQSGLDLNVVGSDASLATLISEYSHGGPRSGDAGLGTRMAIGSPAPHQLSQGLAIRPFNSCSDLLTIGKYQKNNAGEMVFYILGI